MGFTKRKFYYLSILCSLGISFPIIFTATKPITQNQVQSEIKLDSGSIDEAQKLKDYLITIVFENNDNNKEVFNIIEDIVKSLIEAKTKSMISNEVAHLATLTLIQETKRTFKDKIVLEEAWYHWFPLAFWKGVYTAALLIHLINWNVYVGGEIVKHAAPLSIDFAEMYMKYKTGDMKSLSLKVALVIVKLLVALNKGESRLVDDIASSVIFDTIQNSINKGDASSLVFSILKSLNLILFLDQVKLNKNVDIVVNTITQQLTTAYDTLKFKSFMKYMYYKALYEGK